MPKISNAAVDNIKFDEQAGDPTTPSSADWRLYFKTGGLYYIEDDGTVRQVTHSGTGTGSGLLADGTIPLTANWDAGSYKITAEQLESDVAVTPPSLSSTPSAVTPVAPVDSATTSALIPFEPKS